MTSISPKEAKELIDTEDIILIDIRTPSEYNQGHIEGSQLIDFYRDFQANIDQLDKNKRYLIYCRTATRTHYAKSIMQQLGFKDVVDISGGTMEWSRQGYPLVQ